MIFILFDMYFFDKERARYIHTVYPHALFLLPLYLLTYLYIVCGSGHAFVLLDDFVLVHDFVLVDDFLVLSSFPLAFVLLTCLQRKVKLFVVFVVDQ